jgi:hypothetical protein
MTLTMALVYVLGIASANQSPSPLRKPRPLALTCISSQQGSQGNCIVQLTKSLTILPSS